MNTIVFFMGYYINNEMFDIKKINSIIKIDINQHQKREIKMIEALKNIIKFIFFIGLMVGVALGVMGKDCLNKTDNWSERTMHEFYAPDGGHDSIMRNLQEDASIPDSGRT